MANNTIRAGSLRHRVTIYAPSVTQDVMGGIVASAGVPVASVWASVEALSGRELFAAQQMVDQSTYKITIRWMDGIKAKMTIHFDGRVFQIQNTQNPDGRHKKLELLCIERNDSAYGV